MPCAPCSSYSAFDIHSCWKEPSDARIEPPIHTAKRRSCGVVGAMSLTFIDICGTSWLSRQCSRSVSPGSSEPPPHTTTLPHSSRRVSVSHERMLSATISGSPTISGTMLASSAAPAGGALELVSHGGGAAPGTGDLSSVGWKKSSGRWKRSHAVSRVERSGNSCSQLSVLSGYSAVGGYMLQRQTHSFTSRSTCSCVYLW
mmetsp:Transcript_34062/g.80368  ORF Transcript_34062/g.80368 Transcript_34062/m.80368 type:complete len:201 (+) Transcript_34062:226-828(+)